MRVTRGDLVRVINHPTVEGCIFEVLTDHIGEDYDDRNVVLKFMSGDPDPSLRAFGGTPLIAGGMCCASHRVLVRVSPLEALARQA